MRHLVLALSLTLLAATAALAADSEATAKEATEFAKRIALAAQAAKDKGGQYPAAVTVWSRGKQVEVKVQVTPLADGYSIKAIPGVEARASCPLENASIDVNNGAGGPSIVSLVGSTSDGADVVAFATTGTELAVTVTQGDQTTTVNGTTSLADVPAQTPPVAATVKATAPTPAATTATHTPVATPAPARPSTPTATAHAPAVAATAPTHARPAPEPANAPARPLVPAPTAPAAPGVAAAPTAPDSPSATSSVSSTPPAAPPITGRRSRTQDPTLRAVEELSQQPIQLSDGATPIQRPSSAIPR